MVEEQQPVALHELFSCDEVHQTQRVEGLCHLTAYINGAIKAQFTDRTIVRLHQKCDWVQLLNRQGETLTFRLGAALSQSESGVAAEYFSYIQVAKEFLDWAFLTEEDIALKHDREATE